MRFPESSNELLRLLEEVYPEKLPEPRASLEEVQRYAGCRQVVLFLKDLRDMTKRLEARR